jgi:ubiquinone/menaquinone biosynthesis C-methylase UbiE
VVRALRVARRGALAVARPVDELGLAINGKGDHPPIALRRYVGPLRSFESSGAEFAAYLKLLCGLRPTIRFLDVGCGCGLIALQLRHYFREPGGYEGVDIHAPSIRWCEQHLTPSDPRQRFRYIDVYSEAYNPAGQRAGGAFGFPYPDERFDVVLLKSVFTHMRPEAVGNYLAELSRMLAPGGRALVTFFLLNDEQRRRQQHNQLSFTHGSGDWRYVHKHSPESAIAYTEEWVRAALDRHGLRLERPVLYGRWSGRAEGVSFQDLLVLERAAQRAPDPPGNRR